METTRIPTVLFVDDDENLLRGLKRMLHAHRNEWAMEFVAGGVAACEILERRCFDLVITDMKMPDCDGAVVLGEVARRCPGTVRVLLSGQAEEESVLRALPFLHQYLSKPCSPEMLRDRIREIFKWQSLVTDPALRATLAGIVSVPMSAKNFLAIASELSNPEPSIEKLGAIAGRDPGMSAKLLQLVNSSFFITSAPVFDVSQAVRILGVSLLTKLYAQGTVFKTTVDGLSALPLQRIAGEAAKLAAWAQTESDEHGLSPNEAKVVSTSVLLRSLGLSILSTAMCDKALAALELAAREQMSFDDAAESIIGVQPRALGSYLLALWGLPSAIVEAAAATPETTQDTKSPVVATVLSTEAQWSSGAAAGIATLEGA